MAVDVVARTAQVPQKLDWRRSGRRAGHAYEGMR
jgi:hypothetical protein